MIIALINNRSDNPVLYRKISNFFFLLNKKKWAFFFCSFIEFFFLRKEDWKHLKGLAWRDRLRNNYWNFLWCENNGARLWLDQLVFKQLREKIFTRFFYFSFILIDADTQKIRTIFSINILFMRYLPVKLSNLHTFITKQIKYTEI